MNKINTIRRIAAVQCGMAITLRSNVIVLRDDCIDKLKGQVTRISCKVDGRLTSLPITDPLIDEVLEWWEGTIRRLI